MIELLFLIICTPFLLFFAFGLLKIYDKIRYRDELKIKEKIYKTFMSHCNKKINILLSPTEKEFIKELSNYLGCKEFYFTKDMILKDIFCVQIEREEAKRLRKILFYKDDYFCIKVFELYAFINTKYKVYLRNNKNISKKELQISLLGSDDLEEGEVIDKLLEMNVYLFVKKYATIGSGVYPLLQSKNTLYSPL